MTLGTYENEAVLFHSGKIFHALGMPAFEAILHRTEKPSDENGAPPNRRPRQASRLRGEPIRKVSLQLVQQPLLAFDPISIELALALGFGARKQQAIMSDDLLAAADEEVMDVAHGSAPIVAAAEGCFGRANATGKVSAASAFNAVCSSARRLSMN